MKRFGTIDRRDPNGRVGLQSPPHAGAGVAVSIEALRFRLIRMAVPP